MQTQIDLSRDLVNDPAAMAHGWGLS